MSAILLKVKTILKEIINDKCLVFTLKVFIISRSIYIIAWIFDLLIPNTFLYKKYVVYQ